MVPSIVAGSIGGWSPVEKAPSREGGLPTYSQSDPEAGIIMHPTAPGEAVIPDIPPVPSQNPGLAPYSQAK